MKKDKYSIISFVLYLVVNSLFVLKYSLRFLSVVSAAGLTVVYTILVCLVLLLLQRQKLASRISPKVFVSIATVTVMILGVGQLLIDPYQLQVDRWSAIHNFIDYLLQGKFPYLAQTHLGGYGSPFPVWQAIHIPFYVLGNVGWSFVAGFLLFLHAVYKLLGKTASVASFVLLILSPAFMYETAVRSDLLTNFLMVAAIVCYIRYYKVDFQGRWLMLAVGAGLVMSTRLSAVIPLAVYFFFGYLRSRWSVRLLFPIVVLLVFAVTFLPFLLWSGEMLLFFEYNPFILQSRQGHLTDFLIFIPVGIKLSLMWKDDVSHYALNTACMLILLVTMTFVHNMYLHHNWDALFAPAYDITYFNMSLPFIILALSSHYAKESH